MWGVNVSIILGVLVYWKCVWECGGLIIVYYIGNVDVCIRSFIYLKVY